MATHSEPAVASEALRGTVLVIDDDRGPRESLRILLKTEFQVLCAESVEAGLAMLREHRPHVVIMDIRMPGKNGIDGLRAIRATDEEVAVIMVTGFGALETAQEAIRLGANDYLKKPFDAFEIQGLIRRHAQRVRLERRRQSAEGQLVLVNEKLRGELVRKEQLAALGQKSAELVHDLRNPLGAVLGYVELLAEELRSSRERLGDRWQDTSDYLASIEKSVLRCKDLAEMWMDISRNSLRLLPLDVGEVVRDVLRDAAHQANPRGVRLESEVRGSDARTVADRLQLARAVQNLVINAIEAVEPERGVVRVTCGVPDAGTVEVVVEDNGCGMDAAQLARIMEPFYTVRKTNGTGLGLFIARQVTEAHGGSLHIHSEPGKGTRITVRLPRRAA